MLTREEIETIRKRAENAMTAPWKVESGAFSGDNWLIAHAGADENGTEYYITTNNVRGSEMDGDTKSDAEFIAHARVDVPKLLAEIEQLNRAIEDAQTAVCDLRGIPSSDYKTVKLITDDILKVKKILTEAIAIE